LLTKIFGMDSNRMMEQVMAVFGVFMVFFYLGVGIFIIFFFNFTSIDKSLRVIFGSVLIFYGLYRAVRAYSKISELFFSRQKDDDDDKNV